MMRGFVFSLDMMFAAGAIIAALVLIGLTLQDASGSDSLTAATLSLESKDDALMRVFGGGITPVVPLTAGSFECATSFKRAPSVVIQDPALVGSWVLSKSCAVKP